MDRAWLVVHPRGIVVPDHGAPRPLDDAGARALGLDERDALLVTNRGHATIVAAAIDARVEPPKGLVVRGLRELFLVDEALFWLAGRATQLVEWATTSRFCGRCATKTERLDGERCMVCPACKLHLWPRIAPAVIVLVRRGDEALLARNGRFPMPFFSTLAGFAEIGESLEETIAREIREEVGVEVTEPRYFGSQPWPFPHSLMIGFTAKWASGDIRVDGAEIAEAAWFRADALPPVPPRISIARAMIDAWVAEVTGRIRT